jgi:hypothetical protein
MHACKLLQPVVQGYAFSHSDEMAHRTVTIVPRGIVYPCDAEKANLLSAVLEERLGVSFSFSALEEPYHTIDVVRCGGMPS